MSFKRAFSVTQAAVRSLAGIADAREPLRSYTLCCIDMPPAFVLARLFEVLALLDPSGHARLTGPDSSYQAIPPAALDDAESEWWRSPDATTLIVGLVSAINTGAQPQYACGLETDGRIVLAPLALACAPRVTPSRVRGAKPPRWRRSQSGSRRAIRRPD